MDQAGQVREKVDIVSLLSEYIPLKKMGRNFKANCPFHQETTPSFVVSPERQIWHCFGCGKGGDCFSFLMEYENMEFPEALRQLAQKVGVTISESSYQKGVYSEKEKIYKLNAQASKFYNFLLTQHKIGEKALDYLIRKRGLSLNLINTYNLGFAPNDNSLSKYLINKKGYKKEDLIDAGLSFIRNGNVWDFFKGRIIFPLADHRGNIVGFSGRGLTDEDQPKYINTKETAVYHKGSLFFGLESAKEEIKKQDSVIVVEGEFDALSAFKEGIKNVVAIKGTALTENQANLLSRFTKKVILCLDQDLAGFEATKRSLTPLEKSGMTINILELSEKDPDEQLKKDPLVFKKALKEATGVYDFLISKILLSNNKKSGEGIKNITQELIPYLTQINNEIVKEHYVKKLADELDTSYSSLDKEIQKTENSKKDSAVIVPKTNGVKRGRREILEQYILSLIIQNENPQKLLEEEKKFFSSYKFEVLSYGKIIKDLETYFEKKKTMDIGKFVNFLPEELIPSFDSCYLLPLPKFEKEEDLKIEFEKIKTELSTMNIKGEMEVLASKIKDEKDKKQARELQKRFSHLASSLPK